MNKKFQAIIKEASRTAARVLVNKLSEESFKFWQQDRIRKLIRFKKLEQTEQDRIFNEFIVTLIGLLDLQLRDEIVKIPRQNEKRILLKGIQEASLSEYPIILTELGTEKLFVDLWIELIKMRTKEYREDYKLAVTEMKKWEELKVDNRYFDNIARINNCSILCLQHVRRGQTTPEDILWKDIRRWITFMDVEFKKILQMIQLVE